MFSNEDMGPSAHRNILFLAVGVAALCFMVTAVLMCDDESSAEIKTGKSGGMQYTIDTDNHTLVFDPCDDQTYGRGVMSSNPDDWQGWSDVRQNFYTIKFNDGCKVIAAENGVGVSPFYEAKITSLDLGSVETVKSYAFSDSKGPDANEQYQLDLKNVVTVENNAWGDAKISSVTFGLALREIGIKAFATEEPEYFQLPFTLNAVEGVLKIGLAAFAFRQFETLTIPASVTEIGNLAFAGNPALKSITVASGNTQFKVVDGALMSMDSKRILLYPADLTNGPETYEMPASVEVMDAASFAFMTKLKMLIVSPNVKVIPEAAFCFIPVATEKPSTLTSIFLPDGITNIYNTSYMGLKIDMIVVTQNFQGVLEDKLTGLKDYISALGLYVKEIYNYTSLSEQTVVGALTSNCGLKTNSDFPATYKGQASAEINVDGTKVQAHVGTTYSPAAPTKDNCQFLGWTTVATDCDPSFSGSIPVTPDMMGKTTNIYSCWSTTVNYDLNGGSGDLSPADAKIRGKVTLSDGTDIQGPQGEQLASWNTSKDGSGKSYLPGAVLDVADYTVLYAQWGSAPGPTPPTPPSPPSDGQGFDWIVIAAITAAALTSIWAIIPIAKRRKDEEEETQ